MKEKGALDKILDGRLDRQTQSMFLMDAFTSSARGFSRLTRKVKQFIKPRMNENAGEWRLKTKT